MYTSIKCTSSSGTPPPFTSYTKQSCTGPNFPHSSWTCVGVHAGAWLEACKEWSGNGPEIGAWFLASCGVRVHVRVYDLPRQISIDFPRPDHIFEQNHRSEERRASTPYGFAEGE